MDTSIQDRVVLCALTNRLAETNITREAPPLKEETGTALGERAEIKMSNTLEFAAVSFSQPVEPVEETTDPVGVAINPYDSNVPANILGRRRLLVRDSLPTPPTAELFSGNRYNLIQLIRADNEVQKFLSVYKGFRADIRITMLTRAAATMYGCANVAYTYAYPTGTLPGVLSAKNWMIDISSAEAVDFVIPYRHNFNYYDISTANDDEALTLYVTNLFSEATDGGTSTLDYMIQFALENVEAGIYTSNNIVNPQSYMVEDPELDPAGPRIPRDNRFVSFGSAAAIGSASLVYNYLRGQAVDATTEIIKEGMSQLKTGKPSSTSGQAKGVRQSFLGDLVTTEDQYAIPSLDTVAYPERMMTPSGALMDSDLSIKEMGKIPGLIRTFRHTSTTTPGSLLHITPILGGRRTGVLGADTPWSWASYYSRYFRYYRGSHRIVLHFFTSPLVSATYRVSINYYMEPTNTEVAIDSTYEVPGDTFIVKGSLTKMFEIPYHSNYPVIPAHSTYASLVVELIEPPSRASANDTTVFCVATHSVSDLEFFSIQHGRPLTEVLPIPLEQIERDIEEEEIVSEDVVEPQCDVRQLHAGPNTSPDPFNREVKYQPTVMKSIDSLVTLMRRFDHNADSSGVPKAIISLDTLDHPSTARDFEWYSNFLTVSDPFAYISGSVENRVFYSTTTRQLKQVHVTNFLNNAGDRAANGYAATVVPDWPVLDFRTPYLASVPYVARREVVSRPQNVADLVFDATDVSAVFVRAGPDFGLHWPNCLPTTGWAETPRLN